MYKTFMVLTYRRGTQSRVKRLLTKTKQVLVCQQDKFELKCATVGSVCSAVVLLNPYGVDKLWQHTITIKKKPSPFEQGEGGRRMPDG